MRRADQRGRQPGALGPVKARSWTDLPQQGSDAEGMPHALHPEAPDWFGIDDWARSAAVVGGVEVPYLEVADPVDGNVTLTLDRAFDVTVPEEHAYWVVWFTAQAVAMGIGWTAHPGARCARTQPPFRGLPEQGQALELGTVVPGSEGIKPSMEERGVQNHPSAPEWFSVSRWPCKGVRIDGIGVPYLEMGLPLEGQVRLQLDQRMSIGLPTSLAYEVPRFAAHAIAMGMGWTAHPSAEGARLRVPFRGL